MPARYKYAPDGRLRNSPKFEIRYPGIRIMAFSFFDERETADAMMNSGADAYVSKDASAIEVKQALTALYNKHKQTP
jgi:DNA-binding NarL/FixJ family response regulator